MELLHTGMALHRPSSPIEHLRTDFERILQSPRRAEFYREWVSNSEDTQKLLDGAHRVNDGKSYREQREIFRAYVSEALAARDLSAESVKRVTFSAPMQLSGIAGGFYKSQNPTTEHVAEDAFLRFLKVYAAHESSHTSPRGVLQHALIALHDMHGRSVPWEEVPAPARGAYCAFFEDLDLLLDYAERQVDIGRSFFGDDAEWAQTPMLQGDQLGGFLRAQARAFALRFLGAHFQVFEGIPSEKIAQNTVAIQVDPALHDMELPLMLVGPKFACDLKNTLRVVERIEKRRFAHDPNDPLRGLSLVKAMRGERIEAPILLKVMAQKHTDEVWEMRISDNGGGIIVEELFRPLVEAAHYRPDALDPMLREAVVRWEAGDPFAFNDLPYGYLLESVFHLGVSTGEGGPKSGMGLWGSLALLTRLGAQIKVGVTPRTGGLTQSIFLPMRPGVSTRDIEAVANQSWSRYMAI